MSEENKKDVEKPQEINEEKCDAHAQAGACTRGSDFLCGKGNWNYDSTARCGRLNSTCGMQNYWA